MGPEVRLSPRLTVLASWDTTHRWRPSEGPRSMSNLCIALSRPIVRVSFNPMPCEDVAGDRQDEAQVNELLSKITRTYVRRHFVYVQFGQWTGGLTTFIIPSQGEDTGPKGLASSSALRDEPDLGRQLCEGRQRISAHQSLVESQTASAGGPCPLPS